MGVSKYSPSLEIPRDIENEYRTTNHFMERLKYRTDPEPSKEIVFETMENGQFKTTHISDRFICEQEIDEITWWIIVEMNDEAFVKDNKYHALVSVYAPNQHPEKHKTVFEADIQ
jgi:hypothetical protein